MTVAQGRGASYDRVVLVDTLVAHQRKDVGSCICGWGVREAYGPDWENTHGSHSEHVARMYELEVQRRQPAVDRASGAWATVLFEGRVVDATASARFTIQADSAGVIYPGPGDRVRVTAI